MSVSERSEALFLCPKFERYFGVFTGSEGLGDIPTSRKQASVYTDALLAKTHRLSPMPCLRRMKTTKSRKGGVEDDYEFLIFHTEDEGKKEIDRIEERMVKGVREFKKRNAKQIRKRVFLHKRS